LPDLAIEVRWTGGGIEKLPLYARLGVREVWVWERGAIGAHVLRGATFVRSVRSTLLPTLDLERLAKYASMEDQSKAVRGFLKVRR
jgi:Uma2 family endonuclease